MCRPFRSTWRAVIAEAIFLGHFGKNEALSREKRDTEKRDTEIERDVFVRTQRREYC